MSILPIQNGALSKGRRDLRGPMHPVAHNVLFDQATQSWALSDRGIVHTVTLAPMDSQETQDLLSYDPKKIRTASYSISQQHLQRISSGYRILPTVGHTRLYGQR